MARRQQLAQLILQTCFFLGVTRTAQIIITPLLVQYPLTYRLESDDFHHYYLGLGALLLALVFYRHIKRYLLSILALCLAWLIEEHLVILEQLGLKIPYYYLSLRDNIAIYLIVVVGLLTAIILGAKLEWPERGRDAAPHSNR